MEKYNHKEIEKKWGKEWEQDRIGEMEELKKGDKKFYSLYSFPYPSGAGLHVGHAEGMIANDIASRFYRLNKYKSFLPMGWDSFGLPAENYAIKTGIHPQKNTDDAINTFIKQIKAVGISVDWESEVGAHWPSYYRWTQWIFLELLKNKLAYKKKAPVNWCNSCKTALANEQVVAGKCERCDTEVVQKDMDQWFFKITAYADRLIDDLEDLDWPESTKTQQKNWIGRSKGVEISYKIKDTNKKISCFTTRPDTNFGATFIVAAPDSSFVSNNIDKFPNAQKVRKYVEEARKKSELDRISEGKNKTGVFSGLFALNPLNKKKMPIYIGDFVLANVGTGSVVGVPGHDKRDFEFAREMDLEIIRVVIGKNNDKSEIDSIEKVEEGDGVIVNSDFLDGLSVEEAKEKIASYLEQKGWGKRMVNYKLRDWLLSRQRYWGAPIPVVYDPSGNYFPVDINDLPVKLPLDVDFKPTGESPLKDSEEFHKSAEKKYGKGWKREIDTMDTFVDSSWYFLRHIDAKNDKEIFNKQKVNKWMPVDLYIIGKEHIVLHLLYARFITKFLYDQGYINFKEPFKKLRHMGLIQGSDGRKMSKRWGNVINPIDEVEKYGADTLRIYEMFMGPFSEAKVWSDRAESGVYKFLNRIWYLQDKIDDKFESSAQDKWINILIRKVEDSIKRVTFNTAVSKFMEFSSFLSREKAINRGVWEKFLIIFSLFAPFMCEELWSRLGNRYSIHRSTWPQIDESVLADKFVTIAVQINGKLRGTIKIRKGSNESEVIEKAKEEDNVSKYLTSREKKTIYIKDKIVNFVI